ncbi:MAG TPA: hypothetical protein DIS88_13060 [Prevotella sp.]|nr:hypothetical protein [Prevotella sp.]
MSTKGFRRLLFGEKMPDKDDPKYKERYEKEVAAGRKFARWSRLDRLAACVQRFAVNHRNLFLVLVFSFVALSFGYNIYRFTCVYRSHNAPRSVIEMQDSVLKAKRHPHTEPLPRRGNTVTTVR